MGSGPAKQLTSMSYPVMYTHSHCGVHHEGETDMKNRSIKGWHRSLVAAIAAATLLSVAACSSPSDGGSATGSAGSPTKTQPTKPYVRWTEAKAKPDLPARFGVAMVQGGGAFATFIDAAKKSAKEGGLDASVALSKSNASTGATQFNSFLQRGVSAIFVQDFDPASQVPLIKQAMDKGVGVTSLNMPATTQITASQYQLGKQLAEGTLDYIAKNLDNKAKIVHFSIKFVLPERERGWDDAMKERPAGVEIVANIPNNPQTQEQANQAMASVLQKDPDVNVVDGSDTGALGALAALRTAGKADNPDLALLGLDGDPQAIAEVEKGGPYKATYALNIPILGALAGKYAVDWSDGFNVPQVVLVPAIKLTDKASVKAYNKAVADPLASLESAEGTYYQPFGSISYSTRNNYFDGAVK
jgi:ribose transport system substrate-binding protein